MTLLSLVKQGVVQLHTTTVTSGSRLGSSGRFFALAAGRNLLQATIQGELESRIAQAVADWSISTDPTIRVRNTRYARKLRHCLILHDLMIVIFEGDQVNPGQWMISNIVGVDGSARGVGHSRGRLLKRYELSAADQQNLVDDYSAIQDLRQRFESSQPEIAIELHRAVKKGIEDRIDTD